MDFFYKLKSIKYKLKEYRRYRKLKNCSIPYPFDDDKHNTFKWVVYDKDSKIFNVRPSLLDALGDKAYCGVTYHYRAKLYGNDIHNKKMRFRLIVDHCHLFDEVIKQLYDYPETFEIPDEFLEEYSKQELAYLKQIKNYLLLIGLKDWRKSKEKDLLDKKWEEIDKKKNKNIKDLLFLLLYQRRWNKITKKEKFERYNNTKAQEYASCYPMWFKNDKVVNGIVTGIKDYLISVKYSFSSSRLHNKYLLIDSDYKYLGIIEIISENIIPFKQLKSNMVKYKLEGFKNFNEYKEFLLNKYIEESKYYDESFTEDSLIKYAKIKVIKKF